MNEINGLDIALMAVNLIAGTAIGWVARAIMGAKPVEPEPKPQVAPVSMDAVNIVDDISQTAAASSRKILTFEGLLEKQPNAPDDGLVSDIRTFGKSYSEEIQTGVSDLAKLTERKDNVISQVVEGMVRHAKNLDQFNESVNTDLEALLPEAVKQLLGSALSELFACNQQLEEELEEARSELEKHRDELASARRDARIDPLTKIPNRRRFVECHQSAHSKFIRTGESYSLVMFDLDHFKSINDTHGHSAGDVVLQVFAKVLQDAVRNYDIAARLGGEEFVLLLPATNQKDGTLIAERIRRQTATKSVRQGETTIGFTVSAGIAVANTEDTPDSLLMRADAALYHAKNSGRNRVQFGFSNKEADIQEPVTVGSAAD